MNLTRPIKLGECCTTAEFKVNLTRPLMPGIGEVVCEGRVVHRGRTLAVSEATLKDRNGKLLAFGTETCSIFPDGQSDGEVRGLPGSIGAGFLDVGREGQAAIRLELGPVSRHKLGTSGGWRCLGV